MCKALKVVLGTGTIIRYTIIHYLTSICYINTTFLPTVLLKGSLLRIKSYSQLAYILEKTLEKLINNWEKKTDETRWNPCYWRE